MLEDIREDMKGFISPAILRPEVVGTFTACARQPARWYSVETSMQETSASSSSRSRTFRLAPSDFAFLWGECKRCFYLKAHGQLYRPRAPFPTIFGTIDLEMKRHFRGLRTTDLLPDMTPGTFLCEDQDAWVESKPIRPAKHTDSVFIRGMVRFLLTHICIILGEVMCSYFHPLTLGFSYRSLLTRII